MRSIDRIWLVFCGHWIGRLRRRNDLRCWSSANLVGERWTG